MKRNDYVVPLFMENLFGGFPNSFNENYDCSSIFKPLNFSNISFPMDVIEEDKQYIVYLEAAGFKKEDKDKINIEINKNILKVSFNKKQTEEDNKKYILKERTSEFLISKSVELENMTEDFSKVEATLNDGVLMIVIPKKEICEPAKISIK